MNITALLDHIHSRKPVSGFTHTFYRYPARFSPDFVRSAVEQFTSPGDLVWDPFMGGGTVLVEASARGRMAIGNDISELAVFLATAKTRQYRTEDLSRIEYWFRTMNLCVRNPSRTATKWLPYQKHLQSQETWRIRKLIELALAQCRKLREARQELLARCIVLRTAQWALDCRREIPSTNAFRSMMVEYSAEMISGAREYSEKLLSSSLQEPICLHAAAAGIDLNPIWRSIRKPTLVLTSPPYPGVHVLYHRWQVQGRRETAAPFWIAGARDGAGASYYTFGDRHDPELDAYFRNAEEAYASIARACDHGTLLVQMVAFSQPQRHLPRLLSVLERSGFEELIVEFDDVGGNLNGGRVWRSVPNRKWYAYQRGNIAASKEVVLFHRLVGKQTLAA